MALVTMVSCKFFSDPSTSNESGVVVWLPSSIPGYSGEKGSMGKAEQEWLPKDTTYLKMVYTEDDEENENTATYRAINATLIVAGSDSRSLHRPSVCLTAQSWAIVKREVVKLMTKGGELEVMNFHLSRVIRNEDGSAAKDADGNKIVQRAFYCYWWVGPEDTTYSDEKRVWKSTLNSILKGKNERWAYPSVMRYVDERLGEDGIEEARSLVFSFIENYAPLFQKSLGATERKGAIKLQDL